MTGTLSFLVPRSADEMVPVPLASAFTRARAGVEIDIRAEDGFRDIVTERFDAGVRFGGSLEHDRIAVPLGPLQRAAIVATPSHLDGRRRPVVSQDPHGHVCIRRNFAVGGLDRWEIRCEAGAVFAVVTGFDRIA